MLQIWNIAYQFAWSLKYQNKKFTLCCKTLRSFACLPCKMPMFQKLGMREGEELLPLAFQYLIFMI